MSGAPASAYVGHDFVIVHMSAVKTLGSWEAAGCFQRIAWRCERDGEWRATMQEIADEIGVSVRTAKRITTALREHGWVSAERAQSYDATLTWRIVWESDGGTPESANGALSQGANPAPTQGATAALTSSETGEKDETPATQGAKRRRSPETPLPEDFAPDESMKAWYEQQEWKGKIHPGMETAAFIEHARANDRRQRDWKAAWRQWMVNAAKYADKGRSGPSHPALPPGVESPHAGAF